VVFDTVHLGSRGLAIFCKNIKSVIVKEKIKKPLNNSDANSSNHLDADKVNHGFQYWNPNPVYRPSNRPLPFHSYPWNGDHSRNFSSSSPQIFNITDFNNGYQS